MRKLKSIIQYECITSFKYIWIFYAIQYAAVSLITLIIGISMGSFEEVGTNALEMNTVIYVGILGALGLKEDFKMLIQNGFTRKYIFIATFSMFCFISGSMALVDTAAGNIIHHFNNGYSSLYGGLYGYENIVMNWLWLFLVYVMVCSMLYIGILVINKAGKALSIYLGAAAGGIVLLIIALFRYVFSAGTVSNILGFFAKAMGFMTDGTINYLFPILTLLLVIAALGSGSYAVIRRTELR
ncbi:hypothetical protein LQE92_02555 [Lacrimispora sp. NSJ-141]|uniref:Uncharacterized protein n=1 Tax=Lientehia hominis TaxID=2897778 RepID=A0AAP2RHG4_9FIRM|nr:hypothetical protein [Lientehia hominis]MCD2491509.1 hypothetical protein [Lientehia hominis]